MNGKLILILTFVKYLSVLGAGYYSALLYQDKNLVTNLATLILVSLVALVFSAAELWLEKKNE